jgi:hypothetical protein
VRTSVSKPSRRDDILDNLQPSLHDLIAFHYVPSSFLLRCIDGADVWGCGFISEEWHVRHL